MTDFTPAEEFPDTEPENMTAEERRSTALQSYYEVVRLTTAMEANASYMAELAGASQDDLEAVHDRARADELAEELADEDEAAGPDETGS